MSFPPAEDKDIQLKEGADFHECWTEINGMINHCCSLQLPIFHGAATKILTESKKYICYSDNF
jgi:hypothetical protein